MNRAVKQYYETLNKFAGHKVDHEGAVSTAMLNFLMATAKDSKWTLIPQQILKGNIRPDATFRDEYNLPRGYWEAKDTNDDLETEIKKKIAKGYPLANIIFEDTRRAVLYQGLSNRDEFDLSKPSELERLARQFTAYHAPDVDAFHQAITEFQKEIPDLAKYLVGIIGKERQGNKRFVEAFADLHELCKGAIDPNLSVAAVEEMLVQHLLTQRLFTNIFQNADFINKNVIAVEIEKVIQALTSRSFSRQEFLKSLDRYYKAIEDQARGIDDWTEKQRFLNTVYERFFQGYSVRQADTHGIVYTPQEIVSFMCASVEHVMQTEFGKSLSTPGVKILDPCTGTGSFIAHILRHQINRRDLRQKYTEDVFANEIMLLPYYIASMNIEHEYFTLTGEYIPFEGICFADTLDMAESSQLGLFTKENTQRVQREKDADITVIIGNPPYNVGQQNENDNNKNRKYEVVDKRVSETYVKSSNATNKNKLSDPCVKFFRWATDRLGDRNGIVCFVSNNGFLSDKAFDGMRAWLLREFTEIYHLDLHGNVRHNQRISGTSHNVFGIQVGVGITVAIRRAVARNAALVRYHRVPEMWRKEEKLGQLLSWGAIPKVPWQDIEPDDKGNWLTEGLREEFDAFLPIGSKDGKASATNTGMLFRMYSPGPQTNRDSWMYDFSSVSLSSKARRMIDTYNAEVSRWVRAGIPKNIDSFVISDETQIKWCSRLKECFARQMHAEYDAARIRNSLYRPFCHKVVYFDSMVTHRRALFPSILPNAQSELDNVVFCVPGPGNRTPFGALATNRIPNGDLAFEKIQCYPFYTYDEDGTNRKENITDWALSEFRAVYGKDVTKRDIFHYVYALLHDPLYRERYAENLKRELPRIPISPLQIREEFLGKAIEPLEPGGIRFGAIPSAFDMYVHTGGQLMTLHLNYENAEEYKLRWVENKEVPFSWRVEKMRLTKDRTSLIVNNSLTLANIPPEAFNYRLGNRSALEWVIDQYQVSTDKRTGITTDPNNPDTPEYIVRLVGKVITVSLETVSLVKRMVGMSYD
jgi:predicted helicase